MNKINLGEYPPYLYVKDNVAYSRNGDIILCYKLDLPEIYSLSKEAHEQMHSLWFRSFKNFQPKTVILKSDVFIKEAYCYQTNGSEDFLQQNTRNHFNGREYLIHQSFLFFINAKKSVVKNSHIQNPFIKVSEVRVGEEHFKSMDPYFENEVKRTVDYINSSRWMGIAPLTEKEIRNYTRLYFNGFYSDRYTDTYNGKDGFQIGNRHVSAFVIQNKRQLPDEISQISVDPFMSSTDYKFYSGFADGLGLGKELNFNHIYNQFYFIEDHNKQVKELTSKKESFFGARGFSSANKKNAEELEKYLDKLAEGEDHRLIRAHFNVICFSNKVDVEMHDNVLSKKFKEMDITPYYPTRDQLAAVFLHSFFCFASNMQVSETFTIDLKIALCFQYNVSGYKEDKEGIHFNDRIFNIPIKKDIWDREKKRIKARNFFILAPTGEGKSFLALHMFRQLLNQGYFLVINDLGGSYEKLAKLYPDISLYVRYKSGDPLGINPFYIIENKPEVRKTNELVEFVRTLWKRDHEIQDREAVSLRKLITYYYENIKENHSFPNFYYFIEFMKKKKLFKALEIKPEFFDVDEFLHNCSEFVGDGAYAFLFPNDTSSQNINLKGKRLVIFEFDEAKDDPLLVSILLSLSNSVDQELIWKDKSKRGYIFYDEFAKQLKFPNVLSSVEYRFQAIRKQTAGIGIVLQSPSQLPENSTAASIIDNTQIFYILYNKDGYKHIVDRFNFNSHDHNQLMSITNNFSGEIKYSEFMHRIGVHSNIMRLEVSEAERCAYITEGEENVSMMKYYEETGDMQQAIEKYMNPNH